MSADRTFVVRRPAQVNALLRRVKVTVGGRTVARLKVGDVVEVPAPEGEVTVVASSGFSRHTWTGRADETLELEVGFRDFLEYVRGRGVVYVQDPAAPRERVESLVNRPNAVVWFALNVFFFYAAYRLLSSRADGPALVAIVVAGALGLFLLVRLLAAVYRTWRGGGAG